MLKKTLDEFFSGEDTTLELTIIGSTVGKRDLGRCHVTCVKAADQATIAKSNSMDIRSQILESRLPIAHRLAVHDPVFAPDL